MSNEEDEAISQPGIEILDKQFMSIAPSRR